MLSLLSGLAGFISSVVPEILGLIKDRSDKKHELEVMQKQAELGLKQAVAERDKEEMSGQSRFDRSVQQSFRAEMDANQEVGNSWIVGYSATVRPTLTYAFFALFCIIELTLLGNVLSTLPSLPWQVEAAIAPFWGESEKVLFSYIVCFWFGGRSFKRK